MLLPESSSTHTHVNLNIAFAYRITLYTTKERWRIDLRVISNVYPYGPEHLLMSSLLKKFNEITSLS